MFSFNLKFHEAISYFPFLVLWEVSIEGVEKFQRTRVINIVVDDRVEPRLRPAKAGEDRVARYRLQWFPAKARIHARRTPMSARIKHAQSDLYLTN